MKKRYLLMAVAAVLLMAVMTGGSLAASQVGGTENETVAANLDTRTLTIGWADELTVETDALMPGDTVELGAAYAVENTGAAEDVSSYIRVTVRKVWMEDTGEVDQNGKPILEKVPGLDGGKVKLSLVNGANDAWLEQEDLFGRTDKETQVFYYKTPVAPEQATTALVSSLTLDTDLGNAYTNKQIVLEATAEAVQYVEGYDEVNAAGILAAWGVKATLAGGAITGIAQ